MSTYGFDDSGQRGLEAERRRQEEEEKQREEEEKGRQAEYKRRFKLFTDEAEKMSDAIEEILADYEANVWGNSARPWRSNPNDESTQFEQSWESEHVKVMLWAHKSYNPDKMRLSVTLKWEPCSYSPDEERLSQVLANATKLDLHVLQPYPGAREDLLIRHYSYRGQG